MKTVDLPITYRKAEVTRIMNALRAGESCTVVGIGSAGKSNLLRFLQREDVRREYLGDQVDSFLLIYTDGNKLLKRSVWALVELMLHQLVVVLTDRGDGEDILTAIDDLHQRAAARETRYLAVRYLDRAVSIVRRQLGMRLVFLMDECDDLFRTLPARGFSALRALRDDHKYNLMYLTATRLEWARLREDMTEVEAFEELVTAHTIWLGPYAEDDAHSMLHSLSERYGVTLVESTARQLLAATGGHPGLLRSAFWVASKNRDGLLTALRSSSRVGDECRRIWNSMTPDEQRVLTALASGVQIGEQRAGIVERLNRKGIVYGSDIVGYQVFSPLFGEYIDDEKPHIGAELQVDRDSRIVWVNGHAVKGLAPLEWDLIDYLDRRRGEACSKEDLIAYLYPDSRGDVDIEANRLEAVVKRLRARIEPGAGKPRYIKTMRGYGYCLVKDDEED